MFKSKYAQVLKICFYILKKKNYYYYCIPFLLFRITRGTVWPTLLIWLRNRLWKMSKVFFFTLNFAKQTKMIFITENSTIGIFENMKITSKTFSNPHSPAKYAKICKTCIFLRTQWLTNREESEQKHNRYSLR